MDRRCGPGLYGGNQLPQTCPISWFQFWLAMLRRHQCFQQLQLRFVQSICVTDFEYHHDVSNGGECVTGGYVYKGNSYPGMFGYYICIDFISGNAWKIKSNGAGGWNVDMQSGLPKASQVSAKVKTKELFAVGWTTGTLYQVMASGTAATTELYTLQADTTKTSA